MERQRKINCYLEQEGKGNASHILEGIKLSMEGSVEKRDEASGTDLIWTKQTKLNSLPKYMIIHMVRFYYKPALGTKAKILRSCPFNRTIDMFELCSDELKSNLKNARTKSFEMADKVENEGWTCMDGDP